MRYRTLIVGQGRHGSEQDKNRLPSRPPAEPVARRCRQADRQDLAFGIDLRLRTCRQAAGGTADT